MKHKIKDGIEKKFNSFWYKTISNLPFINPEYIFDIYVKIKSIKNNYCQFLKFLEYFYKTYLVGYDMKVWNYLITHVIYAFGCILKISLISLLIVLKYSNIKQHKNNS
ncbi:hypothetical protein H8356DRAFT_1313096 [Neocallimastix lanati (nom. inval.)]|uniref:Uncharacterized protein n=1 Tax=Neocallimastix californiae TaxID=1754190 RepID=A0A1Y2DNW0_9FUNG|nr:hypothetical protein H8356DRAFT_1313096 [Neocallimastix sp. JGI-2020a]ORY60345.1 hypothetical protein LY90DRAFT_505866 [Neocallimastix californiae]|eukprot:ORY60345.1 hypothetical protein LY90DRAFT_505866 [Neocallimastix californiae]